MAVKARPRLRLARSEDCLRLLRWRNSAAVRAASFTSGRVRLRDHRAWLERKLSDPRCRLYVVETDGIGPVGQVRLDFLPGRGAEVSISLAPAARGRGLGVLSLRAAAAAARRLGLRRLVGRVKPENTASVLAFVGAGYRFQSLEPVRGRLAYRLELDLR